MVKGKRNGLTFKECPVKIGLRTPPALNAWLHCFLNMHNFSLRCYLIAREDELIFECIWLSVDLIRPHYSVKGKKNTVIMSFLSFIVLKIWRRDSKRNLMKTGCLKLDFV